MLLPSLMIIMNTWPKIVNVPLTLITWIRQWACYSPLYIQKCPILLLWKNIHIQPSDCQRGKTSNHWRSIDSHLKHLLTVNGCWTTVHTMHTAIIDSKYIVCMYNHLHSNTLRPHSGWATTIHIIWAMNDIGQLCFTAFSQQIMVQRSFH